MDLSGAAPFDPSQIFHLNRPLRERDIFGGTGLWKVRVMRKFDRWLDERPLRLRLVLALHSAVLMWLIAVIFALAS